MFTRFADDLGALELGLSEGQINVTIFQPGKKKIQFAAGGANIFSVFGALNKLLKLFFLFSSLGYRLNDGYWHTVDLAARDNLLTLTIDEEEGSPLRITNPFTIRTGDRYFFGGEDLMQTSVDKLLILYTFCKHLLCPQVAHKPITQYANVKPS